MRNARRALGIKQADLAKRWGIERTYLSQLENGREIKSAYMIREIEEMEAKVSAPPESDGRLRDAPRLSPAEAELISELRARAPAQRSPIMESLRATIRLVPPSSSATAEQREALDLAERADANRKK